MGWGVNCVDCLDKLEEYNETKKEALNLCKLSGVLEKYWNNPQVWAKCKQNGVAYEIPYEEPGPEFTTSKFKYKNIYAHDFTFSPCGKYLFVQEYNPFRGYMIEKKTGNIVFTIKPINEWQEVQHAAEFSPDGKHIIYVLEERIIKNKFIIICDAKTGEEIKRFDVTDICPTFWPHVKFNKKGTKILLQGSYDTILLLSLKTGKILKSVSREQYTSMDLDEYLPEDRAFHPFNTGTSKYKLSEKNQFKLIQDDDKEYGENGGLIVFPSIIKCKPDGQISKKSRVCQFEPANNIFAKKFNKQGTYFGLLVNGRLTIYPTPTTLLKRKSLKDLLVIIKEHVANAKR